MSKKSLILLSGGIDSAVLLWWALRKKWQIATVTFLFKGRRKKEIWAGRSLRALAGSKENYEISLPFLDSPKSEESCYIPKRNLMYYGIAASLAEKINAGVILGGHHKHDGHVFQDARKSYFIKLNRLVQLKEKGYSSLRLFFPFIDSTKEEIVRMGAQFGVPFETTWSCSQDRKKHCWNCNSCRERKNGFLLAEVQDPLEG